MNKKEVCIIGAGVSGLVSIKSSLACDLVPTCLEMSSNIGGMWSDESNSMWSSMQTNVSFNCIQFSDFPYPEKPKTDFLSRSQVYDYLKSYSEHFKLKDSILFNSKVIKVDKLEDSWKVEWINTKEQTKHIQVFDFLIISTGIFAKGEDFNQVDGLDGFTGEKIHSKNYKDATPFIDKRVLVIGGAFSASDVAVEVSGVSKKLFQIYKRPSHILNRFVNVSESKTIPVDTVLYNRQFSYGIKPMHDILKTIYFNTLLENISKNKEKSLQPPSDYWKPSFLVISDTFSNSVTNGLINLKSCDIKEAKDKLVTFSDGSTEEIDSIIYCNGYIPDLSYLGEDLLKEIAYNPHDHFLPIVLYKSVFPKDSKGIGFVGMYKGTVVPSIEMQARWCSMVFSGILEQPLPKSKQTGFAISQMLRERKGFIQYPHSDIVEYNDDLARECKLLPNFPKIKTENPQLYKKLWNGIYTCASYRLVGHDSKPEIALSIINQINKDYFE